MTREEFENKLTEEFTNEISNYRGEQPFSSWYSDAKRPIFSKDFWKLLSESQTNRLKDLLNSLNLR